MTLQGSMHALIILLCLSSFETKDIPEDFESLEEIAKVTPPEDKEFQRPVDFPTLGRDGFGDTDFKQPIDILQFDMVKPKDREHAKQLLQKTKKSNIQWLPKEAPLIFNSPRDEFLYYKKKYENARNGTIRRKNMYDFAKILERNLAYPAFDSKSPSETKDVNKENDKKIERKKNVTEYFEENSFYKKDDNRNLNWTTCDEFSKKAVFHPNDVVDTKWMPFFIWSKRRFSAAAIHSFSFPTKKRVNYYKTNFGPYIKNIDWSQPKLLLKEKREVLLIAGDRKGLFYEIPDQEPPKPEQGKIILPTLSLRMKILNPYIALMYCDEFYATIMAELGTEPLEASEKLREAAKLRFRGIGIPAYRDVALEKKVAKIKAEMAKSIEDNKFIRITKLVGDVDDQVRH